MSAVTKLMDEYKTEHIDASWQSFAVWLADRCATQAAEIERQREMNKTIAHNVQKGSRDGCAELLQEKNAEIERLKAELQQAREAERWIPVGERLPGLAYYSTGTRFSDKVVVTTIDGESIVAVFVAAPNQPDLWQSDHGMFDADAVTHWQPLPEPPVEG
jgi:hypothetical protein